MAKAEAVEIKFKDLREAVVALNESGLVKEKIKLVGTDKDTILKAFMKAVGGIDDVAGKFPGPKVTIEFYNKVIDMEEAQAKAAEKGKAAGKAEDKGGKADQAIKATEAEVGKVYKLNIEGNVVEAKCTKVTPKVARFVDAKDDEETYELGSDDMIVPVAAKADKKAAKPKGDGKTKGAAKKPAVEKGPGVIATILELITKKGPISQEKIVDALVAKFPDREKESMTKTVRAQIGGKKRPLRMETEKKVKFEIDDKGRYSLKGAK